MDVPNLDLNLLESHSDVPEFIDWLKSTLESGKSVSIDTETLSVADLWKVGRGYCRLWQIGSTNGGWAVDAREWHGLVAEAMSLVRKSGVAVSMANAKFDMHVMDREGWDLPRWSCVDDVITAHRVMFPQEKQHGLKPISKDLLGSWAGAGQFALNKVMAENGWDWGTVPVSEPSYWQYGIVDTCLTSFVWDHMRDRGVPAWYEIERQYQALTWGMEKRGLYIDPDAIEYADATWSAEVDALAAQLKDLGFARPSSSKAVQQAFASLGFEPDEFSAKTGDPTYNKMVLKKIKALGGPVAAAAEHLLAYRTAWTWRNNYGRKLLRFAYDGRRIHPSILDMEARTGRSSIRTPALQTIPKRKITRNIFVAPPGMELWAIDYQSQETRVLAALSQDPGLLEFFAGEAADYHQYVADLAGIPRSAAKVVNYARAYGAGPPKLAESAGVTVDEMMGYLDSIDRAFPRAIQYKDEVTLLAERRAEADGFPWVALPYGRIAALDEGREFTQALNTLIQGHGADVLKLAACRLAAAGFGDNLVLPVHDELLFAFPKGEGEEYAREAARIMVDERLCLPLTVDVTGPLARWGEAVKED